MAKNDFNSHINKRLSYLMIVIFLLSFVLLVKLFSKSVIEHKNYQALAKSQYMVKREIPARRGKIFAQDFASKQNFPLAINVEKYAVSVVPKNVSNKSKVAQELAKVLEMDEKEIFNKINNDKLYIPPLKKRLEKELAEKIVSLNLTGVIIIEEDIRFYPEKNLASQVLGFVNAEGEGKYGLEGYYNEELIGHSGIVEAEKDTFGRFISTDTSQIAQNGSDLILSIEHNLQFITEQKLREAMEKYQAEDGSITIINPKTGAILAMANAKDFDPNKFNEVPQDMQNLYMNPVISSVWEPGSIFKPLIMSIAINEGKVQPDSEEVFSNMTVVQGYEIHTAQDKSFGKETMTQCLENSDNVCMVWVANKLENNTIYKYLRDFGVGVKSDIDLDTETTGYLLDQKKWKDINRATISFGQGVSLTPLQALMAISAIANDGRLLKPHLVDKIIKFNNEEIEIQPKIIKEVLSTETAAKLRAMMVSVVENGHGKKAKVKGYKIAGKTGTAQVPNPEGGYFEDQHIGSFVGFFPADNPQFAMLVKFDKPKNVEWAESSAAPVFGDIAAWILNYYQIPPTELEL